MDVGNLRPNSGFNLALVKKQLPVMTSNIMAHSAVWSYLSMEKQTKIRKNGWKKSGLRTVSVGIQSFKKK